MTSDFIYPKSGQVRTFTSSKFFRDWLAHNHYTAKITGYNSGELLSDGQPVGYYWLKPVPYRVTVRIEEGF